MAISIPQVGEIGNMTGVAAVSRPALTVRR
jgi:hypothetical protein